MTILSAYLADKAPNEANTYIVFFAPSSAGDGIIGGELHIHQWWIEEYKVPLFNTYNKARNHALLKSFNKENQLL